MTIVLAVEPTAVYRSAIFSIATFDGKNAALSNALTLIAKSQHTLKHLVSPPSKPGHSGFQAVVTDSDSYNLSADGILITKDHSAGMYSRDCPITFLMDPKRGEGVLLHCGRPALTPTHHEQNRRHTIIRAGLLTLTGRGSTPSDLFAYITAGICGTCFVHDLEKDRSLLEPFLASYPKSVDRETGGLDVVDIITTKLTNLGVAAKNIHHDGLCTKEHPGLASKRGGDSGSNLVIAHIN